MRFKKTICFCLILLTIFLTYLWFHDDKLNYVALGDSLAAGQNPYGELGYGYTDYIADYLKGEDRLKSYVSQYAISGYTAENVYQDLQVNKRIIVDGKEYNIRHLLREADLVTVSMGAKDFLKRLCITNLQLDNTTLYQEKIDQVLKMVDLALREIRKYAKEEVIVLGYYNPFPALFSSYEDSLDQIFHYADEKYQQLCEKHQVSYISFYNLFKENPDFLPNPFDIHPNNSGYRAMADYVIEYYLKKNE